MKFLFLDDDINRHEVFKRWHGDAGNDIVYVETAAEAIEQIVEHTFDVIFLDHDLGGQIYQRSGVGTGWEVAEYIAINVDYGPMVVIHSMNPVGADNMAHVLSRSNCKVYVKPYPMLKSLKLTVN